MNMYASQDQQAQERLLERIEQALQEKAEAGRADEARHGLVAQVANATPPVDADFRYALRARVLAQGTGRTGQERTVPGRARLVFQWFLAGAVLAALLIMTITFAYRPVQVVERGDVPVGRPSSGKPVTAADFDALAGALNSFSEPRTVVVYPNFASPIAERVRHETLPLVLGKDRSSAAIAGAVSAILPSSGYVDLVTAAAEEDETARQVRVAMEQALYRLYQPSGQADAAAYGALERSTFVAAPAEGNLEPVGAVFHGGIELVAGAVLDDPQPGRPLRMAFDWRIQEPVADSLVMFVHVLRDGVEVVAQRDAGLLPVAGWAPGEVVRDQFALLLPPTLPAGAYEIQVGLYDETSQMRYTLLEPEGETTVVIRAWTLDAAQQEEDGEDAGSRRPASQL